jgi:hypothetical protein
MIAASLFNDLQQALQTNPKLFFTAVGLGFFVAAGLFKPFFQDWSGFRECIKFWLRPDIISLFRGEYDEDRWATLKLFVWFALSLGLGFFAYFQLPKNFPNLFHPTS